MIKNSNKIGRVCGYCKKFKLWEEFTINSNTKSGRTNICKNCYNDKVVKNRNDLKNNDSKFTNSEIININQKIIDIYGYAKYVVAKAASFKKYSYDINCYTANELFVKKKHISGTKQQIEKKLKNIIY